MNLQIVIILMEVTVTLEDGACLSFGGLSDDASVYDLKTRIRQRCGHREDQQILKLGQHIVGDTMLVKTLPSEESFRFPERAVN